MSDSVTAAELANLETQTDESATCWLWKDEYTFWLCWFTAVMSLLLV